ncbi:MAG: hypothetical protein NVS3B19_03290 [Ginsengibacter sp.]
MLMNIFRLRSIVFLIVLVSLFDTSFAQKTFPVNGINEPQEKCYAFTNATIIKGDFSRLQNATMVIRNKKIVSVGAGSIIPKDAVVIDCSGKYMYPSFIDLYSDYGIPATTATAGRGAFNFNAPGQVNSNTKGAVGWNQAFKAEVNAFNVFTTDENKAKVLRDAGFGTVLTHQMDGIARGTGTLVTLASLPDNFVVLKEQASAHYSFNKGSSQQTYPASIMGVIALLRQTYIDANWYKSRPASEGVNASLAAWNNNQSLPQIFEANDKWSDLRADRIGNEFGVQYIIKGGGNEYQRLKEIGATKATYILPLNFPQAMDVEDPNDARYVQLSDMKHWEMAPGNPAAFEKANIPFCLTTADLRDTKEFLPNLKKAIAAGLSEQKALMALTKTPAMTLGVYDKVGDLEAGKLANFLITSAPIFDDKSTIIQNWIQGEKYGAREDQWNEINGTYNVSIRSSNGASSNYTLDVKSSGNGTIIGRDSLPTRFSSDGEIVKISFSPVAGSRRMNSDMPNIRDTARMQRPRSSSDSINVADRNRTDDRLPTDTVKPIRSQSITGRGAQTVFNSPVIRLSGVSNNHVLQGNGMDTSGNMITWTATLIKPAASIVTTSTTKKINTPLSVVTYPFNGYGFEQSPKQEDILIKNSTVWTNEKEGILEHTDVLLHNGKIAQVGKSLSAAAARVIDGTGKYLSPGIIDEHSHIAVSSINEGGHSVTSEVRIADNLNPEDINIYRQLSGGVTTSHILHGSANTIGGQTQLIKLRWGANDNDLKFAGADPFIKFALGENVKRTTSSSNNRFPDTRMGVEEVLMNAFTRARDYENSKKDPGFKRDLQLDALVEIMHKKRFITCHSYVQSEITAAMRVGDKFGFNFNTFTHILEGYKVADKMKIHGANASTFSDWWNYKVEVIDAIPQNAALMQRVGLNVAINSDDAEMARRLNQEAAKSVKYAGMSEADAFKMVTLNPAKMLHVDDKVGSIKVGKDADVVLWTDNPLSIYAKPEKTIVDGVVYF